MISLVGSLALSKHRLDRLNQDLKRRGLTLVLLEARWFYGLVAKQGALPELVHLQAILDAKPEKSDQKRAHLWVIPRLGVQSSWSSVTSELLQDIGLPFARVERGLQFCIEGGLPQDKDQLEVLMSIAHDPLIQSVVFERSQLPSLMFPAAPFQTPGFQSISNEPDALKAFSQAMGLGLLSEDICFLSDRYRQWGRDPSDVELMMFAQIHSEHCRHHTFHAQWTINGSRQAQSLFGMIQNTHLCSPGRMLSAYVDHAAVMQGGIGQRFFPCAETRVWDRCVEPIAIAFKVETHNHPTAISPLPGASTGVGGEIRDEAATGRGAKPKAGLLGLCVSHLRIPGLPRPWEAARVLPSHLASAFQIMQEAPLGSARFGNEFGRPMLLGYARSFEWFDKSRKITRAYDKPILLAGGLANIREQHAHKKQLMAGDALIVLGGPSFLIGLCGGSASSSPVSEHDTQLNFASVQRDNPEMQRRCQEVIDACWAYGEKNPIIAIHDVGAGGLSNAVPEFLHQSKVGACVELRAIPCADAQLNPMQIWCNESQERYVLGIAQSDVNLFKSLCERENCPFAIIGYVTQEARLRATDSVLDQCLIDIPLRFLFDDVPQRELHSSSMPVNAYLEPDLEGITFEEALDRIVRHPTVASKGYLITISDRTVGGLSARDALVGPWQVPVADCAITLRDFFGNAGEAIAIGERPPLALLNPAVSARMALAEAITNLAAAPVACLEQVKLSANWMAAVAYPGEYIALWNAVHALGMELCPQLGLSIPVGKDSLSMQTQSFSEGEVQQTVSPLSAVVSAFAPVSDVRLALTPQLQTDCGDTRLCLIDLGVGQCRLGGSILLQVYDRLEGAPPDLDEAARLHSFFTAIQNLNASGLLLAYHDRSDGGLFVTLLEMAFAGRCGLDLIDPYLTKNQQLSFWFNEELGAVIQIREVDHSKVMKILSDCGLAEHVRDLGAVQPGDRVTLRHSTNQTKHWSRAQLMYDWSETSHAMQRLRDNPQSADQEYAALLDNQNVGLSTKLSFDVHDDNAAPFVLRKRKPKVAVLRTQGSHGQCEMAAAFTLAGFEAHDLTMTDLMQKRHTLCSFEGLVACGGFSYADVLGAGRAWATVIKTNHLLTDSFAAFFSDTSRFALGVCNGAQLLSHLKELIPGSLHWPQFQKNSSEQFESRWVMSEVLPTPSIFFRGMAGSQMPIVVAHHEGRVHFDREQDANRALACLRFVDHAGIATEVYPANPNGSPHGLTGFTNEDGRVTMLMPHPERAFRSVQMSWHPRDWPEFSPWMRIFRNARSWLA